jgi:hypothetical protein
MDKIKNDNKLEEVPKEIKDEIGNSKYLKHNKIDHFFVWRHYGNLYKFLNEIMQTEAITPEEHFEMRKIYGVRLNK